MSNSVDSDQMPHSVTSDLGLHCLLRQSNTLVKFGRYVNMWLVFQGQMHLPGRPVATFDPEGLIFAAGINSECVKLYDLRSFDRVSNIFLETDKK